MKVGAKWIIGITISLILIGILVPIGLADLIGYNGSYYTGTYGVGAATGVNATMGTLVGTIIPILCVIILIMAFVPKSESD